MSESEYSFIEERMQKAAAALKRDLTAIRAGRANPGILDRITVDYYGVQTPINQLGNISVPEARMIIIQPWDMKVLKSIEKAIQMSDIGINPNNDGKVIRLVFPVLTEERRTDLTKQVRKNGEDAKIVIRGIRRDAIEEYRKQEKSSDITKDDLADAEKEVQEITDRSIEQIDQIVETKIKEIMEV
ncbi:MAG: ribosome recycling factor [Eubacteriales bacterium]|nr:ribosome recycling factor [Eubacteriales bacterium]